MNSVRVGQAIVLAGGTIALCLFLRRHAHSRSAVSPPAPGGSQPQQHAPDDPPSPRQTKGVRLYQVYPAPESGTETDIDIIAIHGLDTKSPDTWTWKDPKDSKKEDKWVNWLEHPDMLPKAAERVRIFTCDWPADLLQPSDLVQKRIEEYALLLLNGIQRQLLATNDTEREDRPILFIASCLGGIILAKALVSADDKSSYCNLRRATRGIVFLATPFRGTSFQDVAAWAGPGLNVWAWIRGREVSKLLDSVKGSTFDLQTLVRDFTQLCQDKDRPYLVFNFYETGITSLPSKVFPWLPAKFRQEKPLVDKSSATLDIIPDPLPLDRPHRMTNKFKNPECEDYKKVAGKIKETIRKIREGTLLAQADAWIRRQCYTPDRLKIERLSGELLPMDQCYINLAMVEQPSDNTARSKEGDTAQRSSPFSLHARLKVETLDEGIKATLPNLFEPRKTRDSQTRRPNRILIRGRAGVGKTTLCKKIIYEFTYGKMWRDLFDRVLWLPLRNLKLEERRQIAGYNFGNLFYHEYFSQHLEGNTLAVALWHAVKDTKRNRALFILDGVDEVLQHLDKDDDMFKFLKKLLNQPNVIITSRPNAILPAQLDPLHLEMETIGFYPAQVKAYIENAFTNRETRKFDSEKISEVQLFLEHHQLMQGLMRIPIQLDAFCYTWNGSHGKAVPETMTAVYRDIEQSLWKKDAVNLEKWSQRQVQVARQSEINKSVKDELYLLQSLAFTGMHNDVIDFEPKHRDAIPEHFGNDTKLLLDDMLGRVSFLRASDPSLKDRDRNYHFLHLTFQEYFAAQYFVRQWKTRKPLRCLNLSSGENEDTEPAAFLRKYKYNTRYNILWRFVAGLLDAAAGAETVRFFETIEDEPRDLLGPTHQRLVMHCLSEVLPKEASAFTPLRAGLEEKLTQWVLFECNSQRRSHLAKELEMPQQVLITVLQQASDNAKEVLLPSLATRSAIPSSILLGIASLLRHNISRRVMLATLWFLSHRLEILPESVLQAVAARFEDEDSGVRRGAADVLGGQSALPDEVLKTVAAQLEDKDWHIRQAAVKALRGQSALPDEVLKIVAAQLKNKDWYVRQAAVEALGGQSALPDEVLKIVAAQLKNKDWHVRLATVEELGGQSALPDELLKTVAARLEDEDWHVRQAAVDVLVGQSALPDEVLKTVAAQLKNKELHVRQAAVEALGGQSALPDEVLKTVAAQLKNEDWHVRQAAVKALGDQSALPDELLKGVAARLKDKKAGVRWAAIRALGSQSALPDELLKAVATYLKHKEARIRWEAVNTLRSQLALPDELLKAIIARLKDKDSDVRGAAVSILKGQSVLPDELLKAVAARLEDEDWHVRVAAVKALGGQSALPDEVLKAVAARLEDEDWQVRRGAADVLGGQLALPDELLKAVAARLEDEDWQVRQAAVDVLGGQSALPDELLKAVAARLEDEVWHVRQAAVDVLVGQSALPGKALDPYVEPLHEILLERSFREPLWLYVANEFSYIAVGSKEVYLHGQQDQFGDAIRKAQENAGVPF